MAPNTHAILSELHRLLSTYSLRDFEETKKYPGLSRPMRDILEALCREAAPKGRINEQPRETPSSSVGSIRPSVIGALTSSDPEQLLTAIRRSAYYDNIRALAMFARMAGLKVQPRAKESKDKLARRLARAIVTLPSSVRDQVISKLAAGTKSQTEGWIEVIRNTSDE